MSQMEMSLIVPVFNRAAPLTRALNSALAQLPAASEILVGDDASTDDSARAAASLDARVRVFSLVRNSGAAAARNIAMRHARGEFLAFLDSDDEWLPGKIAAQVAALRASPQAGLCATAHLLSRRDGTTLEKHPPSTDDWRRSLHFAQSFHGASTPVVRRSVADAVGAQDERLRVLEDWDWCLRFAIAAPVLVLPEPLALIRENSPSHPDFTWASTECFLAKHASEFLHYGSAHARRVVGQHWENAAVNQFRHGRSRQGLRALLRSVAAAPMRNPRLLLALPPAVLDAFAGTDILRRILPPA